MLNTHKGSYVVVDSRIDSTLHFLTYNEFYYSSKSFGKNISKKRLLRNLKKEYKYLSNFPVKQCPLFIKK